MTTRPIHRRFTLAILIAALSLFASTARAQVLKAKWVDESEERISEIRKADLRVIVIDKDGNPVARCPVHIEQLQHAFRFGLRLSPAAMKAAPSREGFPKAPVWRVFNAVSLDAATNWPSTQPSADKWDFELTEKMLAFAQERNLAARWGGLISSDAGRMPAWAAGLKGDELRRAMEAHAKQVFTKFGKRIEQFDIVTQLIDHTHIEDELGFAAIRRLFGIAENSDVPASAIGRACLTVDDGFAPERLGKILRQVTHLRESFVAVDAIAIEVRLNGSLVEAPITRHLKWMGDPGLPVIITNLEVAGSDESTATINLETALRAMFSQPGVKGIYWAGLQASELHDEEAALLDGDGRPTSAGDLLDKMVREVWWSNVSAAADELGNVRQRVFAGRYRITANLPDGSVADAEVFLPASAPGDSAKLVVLQPVKATPRGEVPVVEKPVELTPEDTVVKPVIDREEMPVRPQSIKDKPRLEPFIQP